MVTSHLMPGPAVPGSCSTIACRAHPVFGAHRLKAVPLPCLRPANWGKLSGRCLPGWGRRAWLEGGGWSDCARQGWPAGPGRDHPCGEPRGRWGPARAARRLPARRRGGVRQRAPPDRGGTGRLRPVRRAGRGGRGRPGRAGRPLPVGDLAAVAGTARRRRLTHRAAGRRAGRAARRGRRGGGGRGRVRAGLPVGRPPRGGGAPRVLRGPVVRPGRRGRPDGQGRAAGTAAGRPAPGDAGRAPRTAASA